MSDKQEFVMVPREASPDMVAQAMKECAGMGAGSCGEYAGVDGDDMRAVWDAMLQAAPPAPVAVQPAPVAWHDIASAPKDGTEILLYAPACEHQGKPVPQRITQGYWLTKKAYIREIRDLEGRYIDQDEFDGFDGWMSSDGGFTDEDPPTHWMPLPPAPDASPSPAPVADLLVTDAQIDEASERKAFEAWASDQGFLMQRTVHGEDYQDLRTQGPWEAWQARAILAAQSGAGTRGDGQ